MNVKKAEGIEEPGYPTKRQLKGCAKAMGLAALGLGSALAAGCDPGRTGGVVAPVREGGAVVEEPWRLGGEPAMEPKPEPPPKLAGDIRVEPAKP